MNTKHGVVYSIHFFFQQNKSDKIGSLLEVWSHSIRSGISPENKQQKQMKEHFAQTGFTWRQGQMTNITKGVSKIWVLLPQKAIYSNSGCWH